jgi:hypothetical protein
MSGAGRPERPLPITAGPLARFAGELRQLRGSRTYRELAAATGLSIATLRAAAAGERLPAWKVARAFTAACGGDEATIRTLWESSCTASGRRVPRDYWQGKAPVPVAGEVTNAAQLIDMMKCLRTWAGNPSLAKLNQLSGGFLLPPSTVSDMLCSTRLPSGRLLSAYVRACGLNDNQAAIWESALADLRNRELTTSEPLTAHQLAELDQERRASEVVLPDTAKPRRVLPADGRLCTLFAVDIAGFTRPGRDDDIRLYLHKQLYEVLEKAFDDSGIPWARCFHEDRGDGALIVVPPGVACKGIIDPLAERLRGLIRRHNHVSCQAAGIQLRAAAHIGLVEHDGHGFVGGDINLLFRMLEARVLRRALASSSAELALIVSDDIYRLVRWFPSRVSPDTFQRVRFQVKHTRAWGWTYLPGAEPIRVAGAGRTPKGEARSWFVETASGSHGIEAEPAHLVYDSGKDRREAAGAQPETASLRRLTFTSVNLTMELEVSGDSLLGQVIPSQGCVLEMHSRVGAIAITRTDAVGCFAIDSIPDTPFRLRCRTVDETDLLTPWISL